MKIFKYSKRYNSADKAFSEGNYQLAYDLLHHTIMVLNKEKVQVNKVPRSITLIILEQRYCTSKMLCHSLNKIDKEFNFSEHNITSEDDLKNFYIALQLEQILACYHDVAGRLNSFNMHYDTENIHGKVERAALDALLAIKTPLVNAKMLLLKQLKAFFDSAYQKNYTLLAHCFANKIFYIAPLNEHEQDFKMQYLMILRALLLTETYQQRSIMELDKVLPIIGSGSNQVEKYIILSSKAHYYYLRQQFNECKKTLQSARDIYATLIQSDKTHTVVEGERNFCLLLENEINKREIAATLGQHSPLFGAPMQSEENKPTVGDVSPVTYNGYRP